MDALKAAFIAYSRANEIDPFIGRRIPVCCGPPPSMTSEFDR